MRRAFGIDVLECPGCGGRLVLLACITQPRVIQAILGSLGLAADIPEPAPARAPPDDAAELGLVDDEPSFDLQA